MSHPRYTCADCGSDKVQETAWVWMNGREALPGEGPMDPCDSWSYWCEACQAHPSDIKEDGQELLGVAA